MLTRLVDRSEIRKAARQLERTLTRNRPSFQRVVGFQGGSTNVRISWHSGQGVWFHASDAPGRYWFILGTGDPRIQAHLSITTEVNVPFEGVNRRVAGAFARDADGHIYLVHSGKIGGGKPGVGKTGFLDYVSDKLVAMNDTDGRTSWVLVIGDISDEQRLWPQIGRFAKLVEAFKARPRSAASATLPAVSLYRQEFIGAKKPYLPTEVAAIATHGMVVDELRNELLKLGFAEPVNDKARDLLLLHQHPQVIFEVKTGLTTQEVYCGIGQLLFHGAQMDPSTLKILVLPDGVDASAQRVIADLGIGLLMYRWRDRKPVFPSIMNVVKGN